MTKDAAKFYYVSHVAARAKVGYLGGSLWPFKLSSSVTIPKF
jgi:hypothetical protein